MLNPIMFSEAFFSHGNIKDLPGLTNKKIKYIFEWCSKDKLSLNACKQNMYFSISKVIKKYPTWFVTFKSQPHLSETSS